MTDARRIGIVGMGSIGGSIALAARRAGMATLGFDRDASASECASASEVYAFADTLVIATHVDATCGILRELAAQPPRANLIVDVASVKMPILAASRGLAHFVATHPMAGTERSGASAARADLFDGRSWVYVPTGNSAVNERARALITALGAVPHAIDAALHDSIVALTSHLPQVIASVVSARIHAMAESDPDAVQALCGPAAREMLRLGRSEIAMWRDIFAANAANIAPQLRAFARDIDTFATALESAQGDRIEDVFARAKRGPTQ